MVGVKGKGKERGNMGKRKVGRLEQWVRDRVRERTGMGNENAERGSLWGKGTSWGCEWGRKKAESLWQGERKIVRGKDGTGMNLRSEGGRKRGGGDTKY